ncbi:hypothetical protein [Streptomyces sp. NPDC048710]|uniref:hypothetical protein n=1 Tax=Streptomyces sp. NPDC048710 TaxID=3365586 RepID=UPI0037165103
MSSGLNGLVQVEDGIAVVLTGIHTGDVDVTVTFHTEAPQSGDTGWEEIVEVSLHSVSAERTVRGLMADLDEELPVLSFNGPGDFRLRIHTRGRDTAVDLVALFASFGSACSSSREALGSGGG